MTPLFNPVAAQQSWQANTQEVERRTHNQSQFLWNEAEVPDYTLPDALVMNNGMRVETPEQWKLRRAEILELFRRHMYGRRPGKPEQLSFRIIEKNPLAMDGAATLKRVSIESRHQQREHSFELTLFVPNRVSKPAPVFLLMNNRSVDNTDATRELRSEFWPAEKAVARGYAIAAIQNNDLAPDDANEYYKGVIALFEGDRASGERSDDAWMALAAWGWGASRVMDYFETTPMIDATRVAVIGHSRGGKAALWAGAEDERFSMVISNNSGAGGAALSRRTYGETVQAVNRFSHWFNENFSSFNNLEDQKPFDQHMLISLIAPRTVVVGSADLDLWADPKGEFLSLAHASDVYGLWHFKPIDPASMPPLDTPVNFGNRGYHVRSGNHNLTEIDWKYYLDMADTVWPSSASLQTHSNTPGLHSDQFNPRTYVVHRAPESIHVDGNINKPAWQHAPWTEYFVDIQGDHMANPRYKTRAKMLWDDDYFYVAAEMEEPHVWATYTERDAIIFHENNFEIFLDPGNDTHHYLELQYNALGTFWDMMLTKPYRNGGFAVSAWDVKGMNIGVDIQGTLNDPGDKDQGWTLEVAIPWRDLQEVKRGGKPVDGEQWRLNFSRVQWHIEEKNGQYEKVTDPETGRSLPEDNWTWSPQGVINMHVPEMWGYVQFSETVAGDQPVSFVWNEMENYRWLMRKLYNEQNRFRREHGRYADHPNELRFEELYTNLIRDHRRRPYLTIRVLGNNYIMQLRGPDLEYRFYIRQDSEVWAVPVR